MDFLRHYNLLSRSYPPDLARIALETAILRSEASIKFPQAEQMYFTRPALEQASSFAVSAYRVQRYNGFERLVDLGCSIGGDTLALAEIAPTTAIDIDPLRLEMARANLEGLGLASNAQFIMADLSSKLPCCMDASTGLFFDPARRDERGRIYSVQAYHPPLSTVRGWLASCPAVGVKLSPGVDLTELEPYDAELEFISFNGELKEAVLWFGPLRKVRRQATLLPGPFILASDEPDPGEERLSDPLAYLFEPDPAILRAGLVRPLAMLLDAAQLDPEIAYLTSAEYQATPFTRAWEVEAWFPFNLKHLRSELRARNVGEVVVKKRGSPIEPEALIHELRLKGDDFRVVFLTQLRGRPVVVLAKTINADDTNKS